MNRWTRSDEMLAAEGKILEAALEHPWSGPRSLSRTLIEDYRRTYSQDVLAAQYKSTANALEMIFEGLAILTGERFSLELTIETSPDFPKRFRQKCHKIGAQYNKCLGHVDWRTVRLPRGKTGTDLADEIAAAFRVDHVEIYTPHPYGHDIGMGQTCRWNLREMRGPYGKRAWHYLHRTVCEKPSLAVKYWVDKLRAGWRT